MYARMHVHARTRADAETQTHRHKGTLAHTHTHVIRMRTRTKQALTTELLSRANRWIPAASIPDHAKAYSYALLECDRF
jgi:hypothetical protein